LASPCTVSASKDPNIYEILNGALLGQAIYTAAKVGVFELLAKSGQSLSDISDRLDLDPSRLLQVLRALCASRILTIDEHQRYRLTAASSAIADPTNWLHHYVLLWGEQIYPAAAGMPGMLQKEQSAYAQVFGKSIYDHYRSDPAANQRFVDFMNAVTDWQRDILLDSIDLSGYREVTDLGGGRASLLTFALRRNPNLKGVIFDQPHMESLVCRRIADEGLSQQCRFIGGSFLEAVPPGADLYLIKHVLHDWDDADVQRILKNISLAMKPSSELIIIEGLIGAGETVPAILYMRDLEQMIWTGGRARTREEFAKLLESAGLSLQQSRDTRVVDASIIVATKQASATSVLP
jgi:hypothetical protein